MNRGRLFLLPAALAPLSALGVILAFAFLGASCKPAPERVPDRSGFENAIGIAVIESLVADAKAAHSPELQEEIIPSALVIGEALAPPSSAFLHQLRERGHDFLRPDELDYDRVTKATVVKGTRTYPVVLQLIKITQLELEKHEVAAAWNRNAQVVRKVYQVSGDPHGDADELEVVEISSEMETPAHEPVPGI